MKNIPFILVCCLNLLSPGLSPGQGLKARLPHPPFHSLSEGQLLAVGQPCLPDDPLAMLLVADSSVAGQEYEQAKTVLTRYVEALKARRSPTTNPVRFLRWVFHNTHHQFLRRFVAYEPFSRLVKEGVYNCVSASALFALLLENLGYRCQLYETPFHLYLLVEYRPGKKMMLESTDPYAGLVFSKRAVARRVARYSRPDSTGWCAKAALCTVSQGDVCPYQFLQPIGLKELAGLQYVNQAIRYYNRLDLGQARNWLQKAEMLYPTSRRISGLKNYLEREEARAKDFSMH